MEANIIKEYLKSKGITTRARKVSKYNYMSKEIYQLGKYAIVCTKKPLSHIEDEKGLSEYIELIPTMKEKALKQWEERQNPDNYLNDKYVSEIWEINGRLATDFMGVLTNYYVIQ